MLFTKQLLFIHVPKTGGMSIDKCLLATLPRPLYYVRPPHEQPIQDTGVIDIVGNRHLSLPAAREVVSRHGFAVERFPLILAVIRNPYALEVSRYAYLQNGQAWEAGPNQELALTADFETFAVKSSVHGGSVPIEDYFALDGVIPDNMRIVRFENLAEGVRDALRAAGVEIEVNLPHINQSIHGDFKSYYTAAAEEAVYRRYKWVFDQQFYPRLDLEACPPATSLHVHRLPISGPVRQIGLSHGFCPDRWVGENLYFKVKIEEPVNDVSIHGWVPNCFQFPINVSASINGSESRATFAGGEYFKWDLPCSLIVGETAEVKLSSSETWCPKAAGASNDERKLSFQLARVAFGDVEVVQPGPSGSDIHRH
jgi:hypothetical protein